MVPRLFNAGVNNKPTDKEKYIHPDGPAKPLELGREMDKYHQHGSNSSQVLYILKPAFQLK